MPSIQPSSSFLRHVSNSLGVLPLMLFKLHFEVVVAHLGNTVQTGALWFNLDPFGLHDDGRLWDVMVLRSRCPYLVEHPKRMAKVK